MRPDRLEVALDVKGFMPPDEGLALHRVGELAGRIGPLVEIGAYAGKSACYLGDAAESVGAVLFSVDHHRGSEENQQGWVWHDPDLVDSFTGTMDTLPFFRKTIWRAGLEKTVIAVVGDSTTVANNLTTPLGLVFIDGGHAYDVAESDYKSWSPKILPGGYLVFHDIFEDPKDGGQAPFRVYQLAIGTTEFEKVPELDEGSLRVLRRVKN